VRVSTVVGTDPADAFEVFTRDTSLWWRRDPRFRISSAVPGTVRFEAAEGARVLEEFPDGERNEIGTILVWQPGRRLVFEWRSGPFDPNDCTEVEVTFARVNRGTEVTRAPWVEVRTRWPRLPRLAGPLVGRPVYGLPASDRAKVT